jgi:hypothetical protein
MKKFVAEQNIAHFKHLLDSEPDERQRALLQRMIAEEEAKLGEGEDAVEVANSGKQTA